MARTVKKVVQGTYISIDAKKVFAREAKRQGVTATTICSEYLEKVAKKLMTKETYEGNET